MRWRAAAGGWVQSCAGHAGRDAVGVPVGRRGVRHPTGGV